MEVEDLKWRKSSYSENGGASCVEVASIPGKVLVRDTKRREAGAVAFSREAWDAMVAEIKAGHLAL